ncbi:DUF6220 domain-containing protein [Dactylosporangium sp. CA-233914]|uniref:DUF6220 domain-containing protein n=1 Tax=Dactylosporangium sp. CA-233914 TaxID=3239934 RepID=UPI003D91A9CF
MRKVYVGLSALLLLAVLAQFYFAAVGAFAKPQHEDSFALHDATGMMVIPLLSLLATIAAATARAPGKLIGLTILPLGLVVVQVLIVTLGRAVSGTEDTTTAAGLTILGLHAINGLAIMAVAGVVFRRARLLAVAAPASEPAGAARSAATPSA